MGWNILTAKAGRTPDQREAAAALELVKPVMLIPHFNSLGNDVHGGIEQAKQLLEKLGKQIVDTEDLIFKCQTETGTVRLCYYNPYARCCYTADGPTLMGVLATRFSLRTTRNQLLPVAAIGGEVSAKIYRFLLHYDRLPFPPGCVAVFDPD